MVLIIKFFSPICGILWRFFINFSKFPNFVPGETDTLKFAQKEFYETKNQEFLEILDSLNWTKWKNFRKKGGHLRLIIELYRGQGGDVFLYQMSDFWLKEGIIWLRKGIIFEFWYKHSSTLLRLSPVLRIEFPFYQTSGNPF